jgi:hypothetical protein
MGHLVLLRDECVEMVLRPGRHRVNDAYERAGFIRLLRMAMRILSTLFMLLLCASEASAGVFRTNTLPNGLYCVITGDSVMHPDNYGPENLACAPDTITSTNHCVGGGKWTGHGVTNLENITARSPAVVFFHYGVNDVQDSGVSWSDIDTAMNTVRSTLATNVLFIDEILQWNEYTGETMQTNLTKWVKIRTYNTNLAVWCATNNATLIKCHDPMGVLDEQSGELDVMNPTLGGGLHLYQAGVNVILDLWCTSLQERLPELQDSIGVGSINIKTLLINN